MRRVLMIVLTLVFLAALLSFTATYTVRFTEAAVLTTFGKASEQSVQREPGLKFKWPYPVQSVTTYDTRVRFIEARSETQQTLDNRQIVVQAFSTWRVVDPLKFFQRFSNAGERAVDHYRQAEINLQANLRSALSQTSKYRMDEIFSINEAGSKLPELEGKILGTLQATAVDGLSLADYGIEAVEVGISRIVLPEETTKAVFDHMAADRNSLVTTLESQGNSAAQTIRASAERDANLIRAFADRLANEIRARGEVEAAEFIKQMDQNPELAVFLKNLEFIGDVVAKKVTLVFPMSMPGFKLMSPTALDGLKPGELPTMTDPGAATETAEVPAPAPQSQPEPESARAAGGGR